MPATVSGAAGPDHRRSERAGDDRARVLCRLSGTLRPRLAQTVWDELRPFATKALGAVRRLGLGSSAPELAVLYGNDDLSLLVAAFVRADLDDDLDAVRSETRTSRPPSSCTA